jgi:hypothetical protein
MKVKYSLALSACDESLNCKDMLWRVKLWLFIPSAPHLRVLLPLCWHELLLLQLHSSCWQDRPLHHQLHSTCILMRTAGGIARDVILHARIAEASRETRQLCQLAGPQACQGPPVVNCCPSVFACFCRACSADRALGNLIIIFIASDLYGDYWSCRHRAPVLFVLVQRCHINGREAGCAQAAAT